MSLYKQLWLAILLLLAVVFSVSLVVTTLSARAYLEEQLELKNTDNATALALSLSQQGADEVLLELTLSAQFDTGFYELIELRGPEGEVRLRRADDTPAAGAPAWFIAALPIRAPDGVAPLQSGWQQAGTLVLRSHARFAYEELWQNTLLLAGVFMLAGLVAGLLGNALLRRILSPLSGVVEQAEAIGNRRFVTLDEPVTLEFRQLVVAMNTLSGHVKSMLGREAKRLERWQKEARTDPVTGLSNRAAFMAELESRLRSDDVNSAGSLCLVRVGDLALMNETHGRSATDDLLRDIGQALNRSVVQHSGWFACRLNGSDFAVLAPRNLDAEALGAAVHEVMRDALIDHESGRDATLAGSCTPYRHQERASDLLSRLDAALISTEVEERGGIRVTYESDLPVKPLNEQLADWRTLLQRALDDKRFSLTRFPVLNQVGELIHMEAPARLKLEDEILSAGQFLPWVNRLKLSGELDRQVITLALTAIEADRQPLAVNLTGAAIADTDFVNWLEAALTQHHEAAPLLWLEVPEQVVFQRIDQFKRFCHRVSFHQARVGIEHVGQQIARLGQLHDAGLDYLKVDASFVRGIENNPGNQVLLRTLCTLGHAIGLQMIAEGVQEGGEWKALMGLGFDGATGPGIRR